MTKEEIKVLAEKVYGKCDWHDSALSHLEQFAKLIAEKEREACAECGADGGHALYCVACAEKFVKREWVGLTDEDKQKLAAEHHDWESLYLAVEAKLKEKNT